MSDKDPYIGETYLDLDPRQVNRRIRVTNHGRKEFGDYYIAEVITSDSNPRTIGRTNAIQAKTLDKRYRKVSH